MKRLTFFLMAACALPVMCFADLHDPNNAADYMIVTTQQLINEYPWINLLADWRNAHGRTAMVVSTEDIWSEFGTGVPSDTVLKTFLHYARKNWQEPQLRDVFIVGHHDVVPSHVEHDTIPAFAADYLSDVFYATDPDSDNYLPLLNMGRLPWTPQGNDDLWNYFNKIVAYETAPNGPWQTRVHLIADTTDGMFDFANDFAEPLAQRVQPGYTIERDYLDYPVGNPWHGDREEVLSNMNAGSYLLEYYGHCGNCPYPPYDTCTTIFWSRSMQLDSLDFNGLGNGERLPIVVGSAMDIRPYSLEVTGIPTALLANENGGAIAYFGWMVGWYSTGVAIKRNLTRLATSDSVATLGELWNLTGAPWIVYRDSPSRQTLLGMMLFGDPGLVIPSPSHPSTIELPQSFRINGNYPNPFNSTTNIEFELSTATYVKLSVFSLLGQRVATPFEGWKIPGKHTILWNAGEFPSGVYFAVLQAGEAAHTIKMMMLK